MMRHLAWKHRPGKLPEQGVVPTREPGYAEAALKPLLVGLCGTDRGIVAGTYPGTDGVVLGHEGIGIVEQVGGGVHRSLLGQRVVVNPTMWCDRCGPCRDGRTNSCEDKAAWEIGVSRDGLLQQWCVVPVRALHALPADLPDRAAVMIEPLACVLHALSRVSPVTGQDALVMGGGPIGCAVALALADRLGSRPAVAETDPHRRHFLATELGMTAVVAPSREKTYDLVVDTIGTQVEASLSLVRTSGSVLVMGCRSDSIAVIRPFDLISRQVAVIFSCDYDAAVFPQAISAAQVLRADRIVSDEMPFSQVDAAFAMLGAGPAGDGAYRAQKIAIRVD